MVNERGHLSGLPGMLNNNNDNTGVQKRESKN